MHFTRGYTICICLFFAGCHARAFPFQETIASRAYTSYSLLYGSAKVPYRNVDLVVFFEV